LPLFKSGGSIILNASTVATMGGAAMSVYSATKAAVRNFARSWILDLKGQNIRVNVLSPGATSTEGLRDLFATTGAADEVKAGLVAGIPLGRFGDPDEIGKAAVFLASEDSSYVNGSELFVDGGLAQI
jgi:NAD(P)-dependent dehydrogenase (short-subunit alcohol dehydrogenase family)